jgi:hypothetical protein
MSAFHVSFGRSAEKSWSSSPGRAVLVEQVGHDRKRMMAVSGALEAALLPSLEAVLPHQPSGPPPANPQATILKLRPRS